jgi:hypothetical protein
MGSRGNTMNDAYIVPLLLGVLWVDAVALWVTVRWSEPIACWLSEKRWVRRLSENPAVQRFTERHL